MAIDPNDRAVARLPNTMGERMEKAIRSYCAKYPSLSATYVRDLVRRRALVFAHFRAAELAPNLNVRPEFRSSNRGR